jgi:hypothetical protein
MFNPLRRGGFYGRVCPQQSTAFAALSQTLGNLIELDDVHVRRINRRVPMNLPLNSQPGRLPKRFPVGTTYVVEAHGSMDGNTQVFSRYVVLPGGRRINITAESGGSASARARRPRSRAQKGMELRSHRSKKFLSERGTSGQRRR